MMEWAFLWLLCGLIAMVIGNKKGEGCGAFILGCLFGPFGIVFAVISTGDRRQCPFCREWIDPAASVCPRCQRDQPPQGQKKKGFFEKAGRWIGRAFTDDIYPPRR